MSRMYTIRETFCPKACSILLMTIGQQRPLLLECWISKQPLDYGNLIGVTALVRIQLLFSSYDLFNQIKNSMTQS